MGTPSGVAREECDVERIGCRYARSDSPEPPNR
jgi:hypothetical protein